MKKFVIIFYLFLISLCVSAQNESSISHTKTPDVFITIEQPKLIRNIRV